MPSSTEFQIMGGKGCGTVTLNLQRPPPTYAPTHVHMRIAERQLSLQELKEIEICT
jgi:hypothetical protein